MSRSLEASPTISSILESTTVPEIVTSAVPEATDAVPPPVETGNSDADPSPVPEVTDAVLPVETPAPVEEVTNTDPPATPNVLVPAILSVLVPPALPNIIVLPALPNILVPPALPNVLVPPAISTALPGILVPPAIPTGLPNILVPPAIPDVPPPIPADVLVPPTIPDIEVPPPIPTDVIVPPAIPDVLDPPDFPVVPINSSNSASPDALPTTDRHNRPPKPANTETPVLVIPDNSINSTSGRDVNNKVVTDSPDGTLSADGVVPVPNDDPSSAPTGGGVEGLPQAEFGGTEPPVSVPENENESSSSGSSSSGIIVGVICGILLLAVAIAAFVMYRRRRASRRRGEGAGQLEVGNSTFDVLDVRSIIRVDDTEANIHLPTQDFVDDAEALTYSRDDPTLSISITDEPLLPDLKYPDVFSPPNQLDLPSTIDEGLTESRRNIYS